MYQRCLTSTIIGICGAVDANTLALLSVCKSIPTALATTITKWFTSLGGNVIVKHGLPLNTWTHVQWLTAHVLPLILTALVNALLQIVFLWLGALRTATALLLEIVAVTLTTSVIELATTCFGRVEVPTGCVILARSQLSGQFANGFV